MYCIIIAGIPASGKTSLADHLARGLPFILENNFENISREGLEALLDRYSYTPVVISLTGDYRELYRRFLDRNSSPGRHRGHAVNCYPEPSPGAAPPPVSYEAFVSGIIARGMDQFSLKGPRITLDTTDFTKIDCEKLLREIRACQKQLQQKPVDGNSEKMIV